MSNPDDISSKIERLESLPKTDLNIEWEEVFGAPPPDQASKGFLTGNIAWRLQVDALGGPTPGTDTRLAKFAAAFARDADDPAQTSRSLIRPGTRLLREWQGVTHEVVTDDDGFVWRDQRYKSLSAIATEITGSRWSGPVFFGLKRKTDNRIGGDKTKREHSSALHIRE